MNLTVKPLYLKIEAMPVNRELTVKLPPLNSEIYPNPSKDKNVYGTITIKQ